MSLCIFFKKVGKSNTTKAALPTCAAQRYRNVGCPCAAPSPPKMGKDRRSGNFHPSKVLAKLMVQMGFSTDNNGIIYFLPRAEMIKSPVIYLKIEYCIFPAPDTLLHPWSPLCCFPVLNAWKNECRVFVSPAAMMFLLK